MRLRSWRLSGELYSTLDPTTACVALFGSGVLVLLRFLRWLWYKTAVPIFLERFVLAVCAAGIIALIINPMKFDNTQRATLSLAIVFFAYFVAHTVYVTAKPSKDLVALKERGSRLSTEILEFLADRRRSEPPYPNARETWGRDAEAMMRFSQETMNQFSVKFGARVIAMRDELLEQGLTDKELDSFYHHPTNQMGIHIVGERIGALAERLP